MELQDEHISLLTDVATSDGRYVSEENIAAAGELVRGGYLRPESDYDGMLIHATKKAINALRARGLIKPREADDWFSGHWRRV